MSDGKQIRNQCVLLHNSVCGVCDDHMTATSAQERLWSQRMSKHWSKQSTYVHVSKYIRICLYVYVCTVYMCMVDLLIVHNNNNNAV